MAPTCLTHQCRLHLAQIGEAVRQYHAALESRAKSAQESLSVETWQHFEQRDFVLGLSAAEMQQRLQWEIGAKTTGGCFVSVSMAQDCLVP